MVGNSKCTICLILVISFYINVISANANEIADLNIYRIQPDLLETYDVIKKGTTINVTLQSNVFSNKSEQGTNVLFNVVDDNEPNLRVTGSVSKIVESGRASMAGVLEFLTDKLYLSDGRVVPLSASSPNFKSSYPPHANSNLAGTAKAITTLTAASGPVTLGIGYGAGFLASGLLSAHQNGIKDFFWGGFDGIGFSFVEKVFRKQPELTIGKGSQIPLTLNKDLKISKGVHKEKLEIKPLHEDEAIKKIDKLLEWGDLTGALELSIKTGHREKYEEIMKKISS